MANQLLHTVRLTKGLLSVCLKQLSAGPLLALRRQLSGLRPAANVYSSCPASKSFRVPIGKEIVTVETIADGLTPQDFIRIKTLNTVGRKDRRDPFYVVNLSSLIDRYHKWFETLPSVQPFYAVKCNPDPVVLKTLSAMGAGFDCASMNELRLLLELGVPPERLVYANPIKQLSHLQYSARQQVNLMTFDSENELYGIKSVFPGAHLLLRIQADDPDSIFPAFGVKFGCTLPEAHHLVNVAKGLSLNLTGVAFHVSSLSQNPRAYSKALKMAADVFDYAHSQGYEFNLLDIGGGYPGYERMQDLFEQQTTAIREGLNNFKSYPNLKVISEPGYYLACLTHTLAVNVIGKKVVEDRQAKSFKYYVNDGLFGSFLISGLLKLQLFQPVCLKEDQSELQAYHTSLWGPSCACIDKICDTVMPELKVGDWIYFTEMGAYTAALATEFNGFPKPQKYYYVSERHGEYLAELLQQK